MNTSSKKEFSIIIDGITHHVKVQELAGGDLEVELDGRTHRISLSEIPGQEPISSTPKTVKTAKPVPAVPKPPADQRHTNGTNEISAPMPGDIVQIMVDIGDHVTVGQEVCVLEAMKMKNVLRASRPGVVKSILVSLGQSVNYGDVLIKYEE